jgi:hypothetical protein
MGGQTSGPTNLNDVWSTADPINSGWNQATSAAAWSGRLTFGLLNFNNRMWVISGQQDGVNYSEYLGTKDIWWSLNGSSWNLATDTADFAGRDFFSATVFNDRLWLTGGDSNQGTMDDVWASRYADLSYFVMQPETGNVIITAAVDSTLTFDFPDDTTCSFDTLATDKIKTCGYSLTIITNAANGYTGSIGQNHAFESQSGEISPATDFVHANGAITGEFGEYGIAVNTTDTAGYFPEFTGLCSEYNNQSISNLPAKGMPDTENYTFASSVIPTNGVSTGKTDFCHGIRIKWNAPAGTYNNIITLSVVGNF